MLHKALSATGIVAAVALFARLAGAGRTWLPSAIALAGVALLTHVANAAVASQSASGKSAARYWLDHVRRHRFVLGLAALMIIASIVRLTRVSGDIWHAAIDIDENRLATNVRQFFLTGQIGHETVEHYPGVVFWMMAGSSLLAYLWELMQGAIRSLPQMPVQTFAVAGRVTNAFVGVATVAVTGLLGFELGGDAVGLIAAGLVAIVPLSVGVTTLLRNDPGQTLFLTAAAYAALVAYRSDRWSWVTAAGALAGIATGIKYTSVFALVPALLAATLSGTWPHRLRRASAATAGFAVALAVTNHFIWSDFPNFLTQLSDQVAVWGPAHWSADQDPANFRRLMLTDYGIGSIMLLVAAGQGAYTLSAGRAKSWVFWSFPLLYGWLTMQRPTLFPRWVYPFVPFVSVASAAGLVSVLTAFNAWPGWSGTPSRSKRRTATLAFVSILALAQPIWGGIETFGQRLRTPTHEIVEAWLREHAAGGTVLAEDDVLDFSGMNVHVRRVPSLRDALRGGINSLCTADWVVVPEPDKGNPALHRLAFVARFDAGWGYRGTTGLDYEIYATPKLPVSEVGEDVRLDDARAAEMLGPEWRADDRKDGLALPRDGATLFLPPFARDSTNIEVALAGTEAGSKNAPIILSAAGTTVDLAVVASDKDGNMRLAGTVHLPRPRTVTELRVSPSARASRIRVVRFRFD